MSGSATTASPEAVPTGNTYDKYGSANPVVKRLMAGFERDMHELLETRAPDSIIDVGCGEGVLTEKWADRPCRRARRRHRPRRPQAARASGRAARARTSSSRPARATSFRSRDGEFEAATAMEVLEHVPDPGAVLAEMARVASRWILVSVPREPLWRMLNMARGAYLRDLGNTPGHLNHWSKRGFAVAAAPPRRGRRASLSVALDDGARPRWLATPARGTDRRAGTARSPTGAAPPCCRR